MNSAGPTSWYVTTRQSGGMGCGCAVPLPCAGGRRHDRLGNMHRSIHRFGKKKPAGTVADAMSLAASAPVGAGVADATELAHALLASLLRQAPTHRIRHAGTMPHRESRGRNQPLSPSLTNYR